LESILTSNAFNILNDSYLSPARDVWNEASSIRAKFRFEETNAVAATSRVGYVAKKATAKWTHCWGAYVTRLFLCWIFARRPATFAWFAFSFKATRSIFWKLEMQLLFLHYYIKLLFRHCYDRTEQLLIGRVRSSFKQTNCKALFLFIAVLWCRDATQLQKLTARNFRLQDFCQVFNFSA